jgi:hypothetical protein
MYARCTSPVLALYWPGTGLGVAMFWPWALNRASEIERGSSRRLQSPPIQPLALPEFYRAALALHKMVGNLVLSSAPNAKFGGTRMVRAWYMVGTWLVSSCYKVIHAY